MGKYNHIVLDDEVGLTVHQILRKNFKFSAKFRTKMKYQSLVDLNGEITPGYIHPNQGDIISVRLPEEKSEFIPEDIHLDVLYEDDDLMLINKQTGLIVHPTKGHQTHTVANGLMKYMEDTGQSFKIRFANRIDMDTTGIIIVAKNANIQNNISDQMRDGVVIKKYLAIVHGIVEKDHFIIDKAIGRPSQESIRRDVMDEGGKEAISEVKVLSRFNDISLQSDGLLWKIIRLGQEDKSIIKEIDLPLTVATISNVLWGFGQRIAIRGKTIKEESGLEAIDLIRYQVLLYINAIKEV